MPANDSFPQNGLIIAGDDEPADDLGELVYSISCHLLPEKYHLTFVNRRMPS